MTTLLPMLAALSTARAEPVDTAPASVQSASPSREGAHARVPRRRRPSVLPPLRVAMGTGMRPGIQSSFVFSLGAQLRRWEKSKLELSASISPATNLWIPGPWRSVVTIDGHVDWLLMPSPRLDIGPTAGASLRIFRQTWNDEGGLLVPVAGLRVSVPLILSRRFSWALDARGLVDLTPVDMVIEEREIRRLSPFQLQVTWRFNFGHGVPPSERAE